jgi:hypothetical protein
MMVFSDRIDASNEMDMLILMHECWHVAQHALQRKNMQWYISFYGSSAKQRVIVNDEYQAYGLEIEALDMRLGGALRRAAQAGAAGSDMNRQHMMSTLNARPDQWMIAEMLLQFSQMYFPQGDAVSNTYPLAYCETIKRMCLHDGYAVFEMQNGNVVPVG